MQRPGVLPNDLRRVRPAVEVVGDRALRHRVVSPQQELAQAFEGQRLELLPLADLPASSRLRRCASRPLALISSVNGMALPPLAGPVPTSSCPPWLRCRRRYGFRPSRRHRRDGRKLAPTTSPSPYRPAAGQIGLGEAVRVVVPRIARIPVLEVSRQRVLDLARKRAVVALRHLDRLSRTRGGRRTLRRRRYCVCSSVTDTCAPNLVGTKNLTRPPASHPRRRRNNALRRRRNNALRFKRLEERRTSSYSTRAAEPRRADDNTPRRS